MGGLGLWGGGVAGAGSVVCVCVGGGGAEKGGGRLGCACPVDSSESGSRVHCYGDGGDEEVGNVGFCWRRHGGLVDM